MSVPEHLSLVTLGVTDVSRSTAYHEALGWQRSGASKADVSFINVGPRGAVGSAARA